jgi:hypothetical protein
LFGCAAVIVVAGALWLPVAAQAEFGLKNLDVTFTEADGSASMQAGSHPFVMSTTFESNTLGAPGEETVDGAVRDVDVFQPAGFTGDTTAVPRCSGADFLEKSCPDSTAVGYAEVEVSDLRGKRAAPFRAAVSNLSPSPRTLARIGFWAVNTPVTLDIGLNPEPPLNVIVSSHNTSGLVQVFRVKVNVWSNPFDPAHDDERGICASTEAEDSCPVDLANRPFLIPLPRRCDGPLHTLFKASSWWTGTPTAPGPAAFFEGEAQSHDDSLPPNPLGPTGCGRLAFDPTIGAQPTSRAARSPTGLDFALNVANEGLTNPTGLAATEIRKAVVTLPEGFSANPALAEGLATCGEADLARESATSAPGEGCPNASKIGTVEVESPLIEKTIGGALYAATPYENPFNSLLALYIVLKDEALGISYAQPLRVVPDPVTGQLTTIGEELSQQPYSHFRLHFREGTRSPLATPPGCDADPSTPARDPYQVSAELTPWSGGPPLTTTSAFEIVSGPDAGPCPSGGLPPFHPGLIAGTINNRAGSFSPFDLRLSRTDSEQEITHFSIKLPPGVVGKLAGVTTCSDPAIAAATARTGPLGGHEELASPSCPASSYVGRTLVGSGVGPSLAYAPGNVYLAGPYHGAPISIVAITAGVVGPFDIGTVVVREALRIDPETAEVFIDATGSDPIPHIVQGIPVHLRDIRVYTDRPEFVLNPTGCEPTSTSSTVLGSGLDFVSAADDNPVVVSTRFQAADCAALPFHPKLSFKLVGSTKRGGNPSLRAHVAMNGIGEAAIKYAQVALPRSEFLDNAHIGTICTRTQFRQGNIPGENCPAASIYGHVSAVTPILDGPLTGPIYLRSSEHELPDLVAALHHAEINVALVGRVDSVKGGGIRNTFEFVPDAPVTSADFTFFGAAKGLLQNSTNLCKGTHKAKVLLKAHSGKRLEYKAPLKPTGCKKSKRKHKRHAQRP